MRKKTLAEIEHFTLKEQKCAVVPFTKHAVASSRGDLALRTWSTNRLPDSDRWKMLIVYIKPAILWVLYIYDYVYVYIILVGGFNPSENISQREGLSHILCVFFGNHQPVNYDKWGMVIHSIVEILLFVYLSMIMYVYIYVVYIYIYICSIYIIYII